MSNVIDLSSERLRRSRIRRGREVSSKIHETGVVVLVTTSGKVAAYVGTPDHETGDVTFVDAEEAFFVPLPKAVELAEKMSQTHSALLMAMGGFHLEAVRAV